MELSVLSRLCRRRIIKFFPTIHSVEMCNKVVMYMPLHLRLFSDSVRLQFAYRPHHSTERAILKVLSDILLAIDAGDLSALVLLDLSAAFDTVDHNILLRRLEHTSARRCGT